MGIYRWGVLEGRQMPGDGDDKDHIFGCNYVSKAAASCLNMNTLTYTRVTLSTVVTTDCLITSATGNVTTMAMIEKDKEGRLEPKQARHKTLSAYYPNLITLHDYILTAPGPSTSGVIQESDTDEYKHLVKETICAFRTTVVDLPPKGMASGSHQEMVDRVLVEVARRCTREGKKDVLISSDKVCSQSAYWMAGAENSTPRTTYLST